MGDTRIAAAVLIASMARDIVRLLTVNSRSLCRVPPAPVHGPPAHPSVRSRRRRGPALGPRSRRSLLRPAPVCAAPLTTSLEAALHAVADPTASSEAVAIDGVSVFMRLVDERRGRASGRHAEPLDLVDESIGCLGRSSVSAPDDHRRPILGACGVNTGWCGDQKALVRRFCGVATERH